MDPNITPEQAVAIIEFAKMIDRDYEQTWLNDDDKEITTEELAKEWIASNPPKE